MSFLSKIFGRIKSEKPPKANGKDSPAPDDKPAPNGAFCDPVKQQRRDAEIEAAKKKSGESHRDLTETITNFNEHIKKKEKGLRVTGT